MAKKKARLKGLNILLGVTGGIAAYKAVDLASKLTAAGANVNTIMTQNACELIRPKSFEAVTGRAVFTSMWNGPEEFKIGHIDLAEQADVVVIAPATANIIAKIANGVCDDLLSTTACACWNKPFIIAPAMNDKMWNNPAVQWNVKAVKEMGLEVIGPGKGRLACGSQGMGRMAEAEEILQAIEKIAAKSNKKKKSK